MNRKEGNECRKDKVLFFAELQLRYTCFCIFPNCCLQQSFAKAYIQMLTANNFNVFIDEFVNLPMIQSWACQPPPVRLFFTPFSATSIIITVDTIFYLRFLRFSRTFGIWGAWCKVDYYIVRWHGSIRTTPRGTQDKQPLALTWCELPWASADYKTRHNNIERLVLHGSSREPHL